MIVSFFCCLQFYALMLLLRHIEKVKHTFRKKTLLYRPTHEILLLIAYAQKPSLNTHADTSGKFRGLICGRRLSIPCYFVYERSQDSDATSCKHSLVLSFAARNTTSTQITMNHLWYLKLQRFASVNFVETQMMYILKG